MTFAGNNQNSPKQDRSDWMFQTSAQFVAYVSTNRPSLKSRIAIGLNIYDDTRQVVRAVGWPCRWTDAVACQLLLGPPLPAVE